MDILPDLFMSALMWPSCEAFQDGHCYREI